MSYGAAECSARCLPLQQRSLAHERELRPAGAKADKKRIPKGHDADIEQREPFGPPVERVDLVRNRVDERDGYQDLQERKAGHE